MPRRQGEESCVHCLSSPAASNSAAHRGGRHQQSSQARVPGMTKQNAWGCQAPAPAAWSLLYLQRQKALALSTWALSGALACFPISDFKVRAPGLSSWFGGWSEVPRRFCRAMVIQGGAGWPSAAGGGPFSVGKDTRLRKTSQPPSHLTFGFSHTETTAQRGCRLG